MGKVDYTLENMLKCTCGKCPVQSDNACFKERTEKYRNGSKRFGHSFPVKT